jgi:NADPH-dependent curcumin reductase CurA
MGRSNRQIRLARRPVGLPRPSDWEHAVAAVPAPGAGEVLVRITHISLDPAMRGWVTDARSYLPPVGLGDVMRAVGVGEVLESDLPGYAPGDHVVGSFGAQEYAVSAGEGLTRVDPAVAPPQTWLGALGLTGLTAYFGILDVGRVAAGETVVVSGAAGGVGSIAGQIAKRQGARVIGIAGGEDKCRHLVEDLGFDAAIDHRVDGAVRAGLKEHAPEGIDVFFDNVGGAILDRALARLALHARVVVCGAIADYNATEPAPGLRNHLQLVFRRATMTGFLVLDYADRQAEAIAALSGWIGDGSLRAESHLVRGTVDDFPETLNMLFSGANTGKLVLELAA